MSLSKPRGPPASRIPPSLSRTMFVGRDESVLVIGDSQILVCALPIAMSMTGVFESKEEWVLLREALSCNSLVCIVAPSTLVGLCSTSPRSTSVGGTT